MSTIKTNFQNMTLKENWENQRGIVNVFDDPTTSNCLSRSDKIKSVSTHVDFIMNMKHRFNIHQLKLEKMQWCLEKPGQSNFLFAGGSVLNAMRPDATDHNSESSDLDIFVLGSNDCIQRCAALYLLHYIASHHRVWFGYTGSVITLFIENFQHPIQVILIPDARTYKDILLDFDQSCCSWGFDGKTVWASPDALASFRSGINVVNLEKYNRMRNYNPDKSNFNLARRLRKMESKGFENQFQDQDMGELDYNDLTAYPDFSKEELELRSLRPDFKKLNAPITKNISFIDKLDCYYPNANSTNDSPLFEFAKKVASLYRHSTLLPQCVPLMIFKPSVVVKRKPALSALESDGKMLFGNERICPFAFLKINGIRGHLYIYKEIATSYCCGCENLGGGGALKCYYCKNLAISQLHATHF